MFRTRRIRIGFVLATLSILYIAGIVARYIFGIAVDVRNRTSGVLRTVGIEVQKHEGTGIRYPLRDLQPGQSQRVYVEPKTESSIHLKYSDSTNSRHDEILAGYVEDGYCGEATATVLPSGKVIAQDDTFRLFYWKSWLEFFL